MTQANTPQPDPVHQATIKISATLEAALQRYDAPENAALEYASGQALIDAGVRLIKAEGFASFDLSNPADLMMAEVIKLAASLS